MAATDEKKHEPEASESAPPPPPPVEKVEDPPPPPPPEKSDAPPPPPPPAEKCPCSIIDVGLRVLLFASTLVAVIVMVTSKQTKALMSPEFQFPVPVEAKFNHTPAFTYFVTALSVACLYSIITVLVSFSVILKPVFATSFQLFLIIWDVIFLGIVASATGAAAGVGYIGWKGNTHAQWHKVCDNYDKFCQHLAGSIPFGLVAAIILVLLVVLSAISIHKKIPK